MSHLKKKKMMKLDQQKQKKVSLYAYEASFAY